MTMPRELRDEAEADGLVPPRAEAGNAEAQLHLARLLQGGHGVRATRRRR
jgi:hypothetical protein